MPRIVHEDDKLVYACPGCDKAGRINERQRLDLCTTGDPTDPYLCSDCGTTFAEPVVRRAYQQKNATLSGLARVLASMDPDEVGA